MTRNKPKSKSVFVIMKIIPDKVRRLMTRILIYWLVRLLFFGNVNDHIIYNGLIEWQEYDKKWRRKS